MSVVLPCLNEMDSVGVCVREALGALGALDVDGEVIVVDNGSTDDSAAVARAAGAVVVREERPGYGRAVRTGVEVASGAVVVMADADLTYDLGRLAELVGPVMADQADLVLGSRRDGANRHTMPMSHRFVGTPLLSFLIDRATSGQVAVNDSQSGYRAFRRDAFLELGLRGTGMEMASEMLIKAARSDLRVAEVEVGYRERVGTSKLSARSDGWRHVREIAFLAPDVFLVVPGVVLLVVGLVVAAWTVATGHEIALGSLRWQPVFFSTIAVVLGSEAVLGGLVLQARAPAGSRGSRSRLSFAVHPRFGRRCVRLGACLAMLGIVTDLVLVPLRTNVGFGAGRALALAGLAQSLLIVGVSVAAFGALYGLLAERDRS